MNRRDSLKYLFAASGTLVVLPTWAEGWTRESIIHHSSFSASEQETLASIVDTIIPAGDSIGALSVGVDKFLVKLIENCYEPDVQESIRKELALLTAFPGKSQKERESILTGMEKSDVASQSQFFKLIKAETIRGFNTSREVMLKHLKYKIAPGHYYGCVDVKA